MGEIRTQDLIDLVSKKAEAETLLDVVKAMLREYYPDINLMRQILGVAEPETLEYLKNTEGSKNAK